MTYTYAWPLNTYFASNLDNKKSNPHIKNGKMQNPKGLPYWKPKKRYLVNIEDYLNVIKDLDLEEHTIVDQNTGNILIKFFVEKGKSGIKDGMIAMKYSRYLMSYIKRKDGLLGLEAVGGFIDTRLSVEEKTKHPDKYPIMVRGTDSEEANFNSSKSVFKKYKGK